MPEDASVLLDLGLSPMRASDTTNAMMTEDRRGELEARINGELRLNMKHTVTGTHTSSLRNAAAKYPIGFGYLAAAVNGRCDTLT
jgi:hypothetical protein